MKTLKSIKTGQVVGETVGQRKDGSRAVLFDDDTILWFSAADYVNTFKEV